MLGLQVGAPCNVWPSYHFWKHKKFKSDLVLEADLIPEIQPEAEECFLVAALEAT